VSVTATDTAVRTRFGCRLECPVGWWYQAEQALLEVVVEIAFFVASVRVSASFFDRDYIQYLLFTIGTTSETELPNSGLPAWSSCERFEVIRWFSLCVCDKFIERKQPRARWPETFVIPSAVR